MDIGSDLKHPMMIEVTTPDNPCKLSNQYGSGSDVVQPTILYRSFNIVDYSFRTKYINY